MVYYSLNKARERILTRRSRGRQLDEEFEEAYSALSDLIGKGSWMSRLDRLERYLNSLDAEKMSHAVAKAVRLTEMQLNKNLSEGSLSYKKAGKEVRERVGKKVQGRAFKLTEKLADCSYGLDYGIRMNEELEREGSDSHVAPAVFARIELERESRLMNLGKKLVDRVSSYAGKVEEKSRRVYQATAARLKGALNSVDSLISQAMKNKKKVAFSLVAFGVMAGCAAEQKVKDDVCLTTLDSIANTENYTSYEERVEVGLEQERDINDRPPIQIKIAGWEELTARKTKARTSPYIAPALMFRVWSVLPAPKEMSKGLGGDTYEAPKTDVISEKSADFAKVFPKLTIANEDYFKNMRRAMRKHIDGDADDRETDQDYDGVDKHRVAEAERIGEGIYFVSNFDRANPDLYAIAKDSRIVRFIRDKETVKRIEDGIAANKLRIENERIAAMKKARMKDIEERKRADELGRELMELHRRRGYDI